MAEQKPVNFTFDNETFEIKTAARDNLKAKVLMVGPPGAGKTKSALLLAHGMVKDWTKITCIDTERNTALYYSDLGPYNHIPLDPPYHPIRCVKAIEFAHRKGAEVIIFDSISHEWEGEGGCLEMAEVFQDWKGITPIHNQFIGAMLNPDFHLIATGRSKTGHALEFNTKTKKLEVKKLGMKIKTREDVEFEFSVVFEIEPKTHLASDSKGRTNLFNNTKIVIEPKHGEMILDWCNRGLDAELRSKVESNTAGENASGTIADMKAKFDKCEQFSDVVKLEWQMKPVMNQLSIPDLKEITDHIVLCKGRAKDKMRSQSDEINRKDDN